MGDSAGGVVLQVEGSGDLDRDIAEVPCPCRADGGLLPTRNDQRRPVAGEHLRLGAWSLHNKDRDTLRDAE